MSLAWNHKEVRQQKQQIIGSVTQVQGKRSVLGQKQTLIPFSFGREY